MLWRMIVPYSVAFVKTLSENFKDFRFSGMIHQAAMRLNDLQSDSFTKQVEG